MTLAECKLGTDLHVINHPGAGALQFQALFHNYIRAPANDVTISPLTGKNYFDKTEANAEARVTPKVEDRKAVDVRKFTDSVYEDGGQAYKISWPQGGVRIETEGLKDVVIWNPQETAGKGIGDMEDGGWCVPSPESQDDQLTLPQGEVRLRRTRSRPRLHYPSHWRNLDWPTNPNTWVVTKRSPVRVNGEKDLPRLASRCIVPIGCDRSVALVSHNHVLPTPNSTYTLALICLP